VGPAPALVEAINAALWLLATCRLISDWMAFWGFWTACVAGWAAAAEVEAGTAVASIVGGAGDVGTVPGVEASGVYVDPTVAG